MNSSWKVEMNWMTIKMCRTGHCRNKIDEFCECILLSVSRHKWYQCNVLNLMSTNIIFHFRCVAKDSQLSTSNEHRSTLWKFDMNGKNEQKKLEWANQMKTSTKWVERKEWRKKNENEKMCKTQQRCDECFEEEKLYCFSTRTAHCPELNLPFRTAHSHSDGALASQSNARLRNHIIMYFNNDFNSIFFLFFSSPWRILCRRVFHSFHMFF